MAPWLPAKWQAVRIHSYASRSQLRGSLLGGCGRGWLCLGAGTVLLASATPAGWRDYFYQCFIFSIDSLPPPQAGENRGCQSLGSLGGGTTEGAAP